MQRFGTPTAIQAAVLPAATRDRADIIGAAQTGSGKTLAFGLPIMQHLLQVGKHFRCPWGSGCATAVLRGHWWFAAILFSFSLPMGL
eukprot:42768-Pelagomonas_calceolata.AAC.1